MEGILKLTPNPGKRSPGQSERILSFLYTVRSMKPIGSPLVKMIALRLEVFPSSLAALIIVFGGEVQDEK